MSAAKSRLPSISPIQRQLQTQKPPMLLAAPEIADGYGWMEFSERKFTQDAIKAHREEILTWYQGLGLFLDGIRGHWNFPEEPELYDAYRICHELIALEVGNAKVALDTLLAGYYSMCFAALRHILECVAQCMYLLDFPGTASRWVVTGEDAGEGPAMWEIRKYYKNQTSSEAKLFKQVDAGWKFMCSGSHPSGNGLLQVRIEPGDPGNIVGAYYRENLAYIGFASGLLALSYLLIPMERIRPGDDVWQSRRETWLKRLDETLSSIYSRPRLKKVWEEQAEEQARIEREGVIED